MSRVLPKLLTTIAAVGVGMAGAAVLLGWAFDIAALKSVAPGWPKVAPLTAFCFLLSGLSLGLAALDKGKASMIRVARVGAVAVAVIGLSQLAGYVCGWNLNFDLLGFRELTAEGGSPARMAPTTALNFLLIGGALRLAGTARRTSVFQILILSCGLISWLGLSRYLYGGEPLLPYAQMSLITAIGFLLLSVGVNCLRTDGGLVALFATNDSGGVLVRRLLPPALLLPFFIGWLQLKVEQAGWLGPETSVALFALSDVILLGALIWTNAAWLHRSDLKREQAEAAQRQLAEIISSSDDAIIGKTLKGIITSWNRGAEKVFGYSAPEALGQSMLMLFPPDRIHEEQEILTRIGRGESVPHFETVRVRKDGTPIQVSITLSPIADHDGKIIGASKIARDVTQRKKHELEIARLTRFYAALSQVNQAIVRTTSREELFREVCRAVVEHGGFLMAWIGWHDPATGTLVPVAHCGDTKGALRNIPIGSDERPESRGPVGTAFRENRTYICNDLLNDAVTRPWRADLAQWGFRASAVFPIRVGGEVRGILSVDGGEPDIFQAQEIALLEEAASDVSFALDNFVRDEQRRQAETALVAERTLLRTLIDQIPDPIYVKDRDGRFLAANQATAEIMETSTPANLVGRTDADFYPAEMAAVYRADEARVLRGEVQLDKEERTRLTDGSVRFVLTTKLPFKDAPGTVIGLIGVSRDITARKAAEEVRAQLAEIVQGMTEACFALDAEWRFTFVNDRGETLLRHPRTQILGHSLWEVFARLVGTPMEQHYRRAMKERVPVVFEAFSPIAERWLDIRLFPSGDGLAAFLLDIGARKEAEAALRASEKHYRLLFDTNPQPMWVYDLTTRRFLAVNEAAIGHYGFTREEFLAMTIRDIRPPETVAALDANLEQVPLGLSQSGIWTHRKKDGTTIQVEVTANDLLLDDQPARMVLAHDVTAQIRAEAGLKLFRSLLDHSQECIEIVDPVTGQMLDVNDATCRLHGYTREEYLKLTVFDVNPTQNPERFRAAQKHLEEVGAVVLETVHRRKDGSELPLELSLNRVNLDRVYIVAIGRDVTEQRRAVAALRESEERFRQVVETIQEVFWMTDPSKNQMLYISPGYEKIWGRTCESLYASSLSWVESIYPEDRDRVMQSATTKQVAGTYDETYRITRPDGSLRWVRDQAFPIKDAEGTVLRVVGIAEDVTERKKLEEQFLRAQRLEAVGTLSSGIAHDLNNILAPMMMVSQMLRPKLPDPRDCDMLDMLEQGTQRGANIIRQLLTFSRGVEGERGPVQLRHLVREMETIMQETFPREIAISSMVPAQLWPVWADGTQLHQVLLNLCVNARDAMPNGGKLSVAAQNAVVEAGEIPQHPAAQPGQYVLLTVTDTGEGISRENIDRIFEPFFTTKEIGKGTGLGLSTVIGIVKSHGGFVTVYSEPGRGSVFKVYLPADRDSVETAAPTSVAPPQGQGELILVIDDENPIRIATRRTLEDNGYRVLLAADGRDGMNVFLQNRDAVRLVFTDLMMPGMSGVELIRSLHALDPEIKFVAASGLQDRDRRDELSVLGVTEVLSKPCTPFEILEALRRQLRAKK